MKIKFGPVKWYIKDIPKNIRNGRFVRRGSERPRTNKYWMSAPCPQKLPEIDEQIDKKSARKWVTLIQIGIVTTLILSAIIWR